MPVPRRFDRRPPERDTTRINERIRVPEVRLIDDTGAQVGVMKTDAALRFAQERDLDLVEVAPGARPPVCRVLDYSKYKYEQAQKQKSARKHQQQITIREIKFRPKIAEHDYATKKGHVERFLRHKDKVKITIMFRGREVTHPERGVMILDRLAEDLQELSQVEQRPIQDGRNMTMVLGPSKAVLADALEDGHEAEALDQAEIDAMTGEGEGEDTSLTPEGGVEVAEADGVLPADDVKVDATSETPDEPAPEPEPVADEPEPVVAKAPAPAQKKKAKPAGGRRAKAPAPAQEIEGDFTELGVLPPPSKAVKATVAKAQAAEAKAEEAEAVAAEAEAVKAAEDAAAAAKAEAEAAKAKAEARAAAKPKPRPKPVDPEGGDQVVGPKVISDPAKAAPKAAAAEKAPAAS